MSGKVTSLEGKVPKQPLREVTSIERSDLFAGKNSFERYNPDQLASRKGGLKLYTKMMQDEQVKAVVEFKRSSIIGRGFTFEFDETELPREEQLLRLQVMTQITRRMRGSFTDSLKAVLRGMVNGYSLTEIVTDRVTISDKTYVGISQLMPRKVDDFKFYTDEYGELKKFSQMVGGKEKELDYARFIHYVQTPEIDPYYGESELVAAYRAWFLKDTTTKFWAQYLERFAGGFLKIGLGASGVVPGSPDYVNLQNLLTNLRGTMGVLLPSGVEAELMHPPSAEVFQKAVEFHDLSIAKALLIPNLLGLSNSGTTGAYAQSQTQLEVYFMTVAADSARLEQVLNDQLFKPIAAQNWEDGEFPRFKFKTASLEQTKWMVESWAKLVGASLAIATEEDEEYLRKLVGMPVRGEEDTELVTAQQATEQAGAVMDRAASEEDRANQQKLAEQEAAAKTEQKFSELRSEIRELFHAEHDQEDHGNWSRAPMYGMDRDGAVAVRAVHYSKEPRHELDSAMFGTGARSAESSRVQYSKDARLRSRANFYVDDGKGVEPEATVGKYAHDVVLRNLYDANADSAGLVKASRGKPDAGDAFESAVLDSGFSGYVADTGSGRNAVLLGSHKVPVRYRGARFHTPGGQDHDQMTHGRGGGGDRVDEELRKTRERVGALKAEKKTPGVDTDHPVDINKIREQLAADKNFKSLTPENQQIVMDKYAASAAAHAEFVADLESMAASAEGGETSFPQPQFQFEGTGQLKGITKAMAKVANDDKGDATVLADILRGTVVVQDKAGAESVVASIREKYAITENRSRDYLNPEFDPIDGYRDAKFVVRLKNGAVAEIQVNLPKMLEAKNGPGHAVYNEREKWLQDLGKSAKALTTDEAKVYAGYNKKMRDIYGPADVIRLDPSKVPGHFAARSASNSAKEMGQPDLIATSTSKSRGGSTSQALQPGKSERPSDTGMPSALKYGQSSIAANLSAISHSPPSSSSIARIARGQEDDNSIKRSFTRAVSRVNFSVIAQRTAALEADTARQVAALTAKAVRRVLEPERLAELLRDDIAVIGELKFDSTDVGKIKGAIRNALERAWATGLGQAMDETGKARKRAYEATERKVRFADLRNNAADFFEANGFRMAGNLTDGMRAIIQQELVAAVKTGKRPEVAAASIYERLVRKGFTTLQALDDELSEDERDIFLSVEQALVDAIGTVNTPAYLNTLTRTNIFEAMNEARYAEFTDPALADFVVALEYSAILDERTTDICEHLDGHIHMTQSEVWDTFRPPNHYNCRSLLIAITTLDGWDGQESPEPSIEPQDGFK